MQHLIEKLKAATGPDRKLDRMIFDAVTGGVFGPDNAAFWYSESMASRAPMFFTNSVDSAIKLIPEGMFWTLGHGRTRADEPMAGASVVKPDDLNNPIGEAEGDHLAICICIAALEARRSLNLQP